MRQAENRRAAVLGITLTALAVPAPAIAADPIVLPAGLACDFEVSLQAVTEANTVTRERVDRDGNSVVRLAGKGSTYVVTNTETGASVTLPGRGFTRRPARTPRSIQRPSQEHTLP
ncbi:hypothetical protein MSA03_23560 [Microbacterium saccharophilum]|nr:hypothetical protein MSA03_23560 [Microbacterium saccharophilum]